MRIRYRRTGMLVEGMTQRPTPNAQRSTLNAQRPTPNAESQTAFLRKSIPKKVDRPLPWRAVALAKEAPGDANEWRRRRAKFQRITIH